MGPQQLLLIVLMMIGVGNPVLVGITMGPDNAVTANRDAVCSDLVNLAARAHQYYRRPAALGGGGNSFVGLWADAAGTAKLTNMPDGKNANGVYLIQSAGTANNVVIEGVGTEVASDGNHLTMHIIARDGGRPDSLYQVY